MTVLHSATSTLALGGLDSAGPPTVWVIVLGMVFLECSFVVGLFLPGDSLLFTAGVVLAAGAHVGHAWALSAAATVTAVLGNQLGYLIGRRTGHALVLRRGGRVLTVEHLRRAQDFLDRCGFWAVVLARWIPWVRTLAPLIAGAARMDQRRYLLATAIGAVLWVPSLVLLGYYCAGLINGMPWLKTAAVVGSIAFFVLGTGYGIWRYRQELRKPAEQLEAAVD